MHQSDRVTPVEDRPLVLLVTVEEAARRLSVGRSTAYELIRTGELPSVQIGRLRRVKVSDLETFAAGLGASSPAQDFACPTETCLLTFAHAAPKECMYRWEGLTPDSWDTEFVPTPGMAACDSCRRAWNYPSRPLDWLPPIDFGHDKFGHQVSRVLRQHRLTAEDVRAMSDEDLLALREVGKTMLTRIRELTASDAPVHDAT